MFHNGNINKDNVNFRTICPHKEREQRIRISYENDLYLLVSRRGNMAMEHYPTFTFKRALQNMGIATQFCHQWEIYKLFFILHNIKPVWINIPMFTDKENVSKVFLSITKTIIFNKGGVK